MSSAADGDLVPQVVLDRQQESDARLGYIRKALVDIPQELRRINQNYDPDNVAVYTTGSYARGDSSAASDLDIFLVDLAPADASLGNIGGLLLKAEIVKRCEGLHFPDGGGLPVFSRDGAFLSIHCRQDIERSMGGIEDDVENHFTARVLMLIEAKCLLHDQAFDSERLAVIASYFRDQQGRSDYVPKFLINDIARFWKTVCLNFEHKRAQYVQNLGYDQGVAGRDAHKRLKLKFPRTMSCFSGLAAIAAIQAKAGGVSKADVLKVASCSPLERLELIAMDIPASRGEVAKIFDEYGWWIQFTANGEAERETWLRRKENRQESYGHAERHSKAFYRLLKGLEAQGSAVPRFVAI